MAIFLPVAVFFILCHAFRHYEDGIRESLLRAAVLSVTFLVLLTELLSAPYLITRDALIAAWFVTLIIILTFTLRSSKRNVPPPHAVLSSHLALIDIFLGATILAILAVIASIALIAPPNTADAMEYHLPRVLLWVSNHTVRNFPTADFAQLIQPPAAEFIHLHTYLLLGSDRLLNLVEFFALVGCSIATSLIAAKLGAPRTAQLLAALFVVTIPEAILESSGSMNTVIVAFWITTACSFTLSAVKDQSTADVLTVALACGLALFTKGTAFIFLPFVIMGCILFRAAPGRSWMFKRLPLILFIALALNTGQFIRAYQVTGTPLGAPFPGGGPRLHFKNDRITPGTIVASIIRHATLHMETPSDKINSRIESVVRGAINFIGNNPDDPSAVWLGYSFSIGHPSRLETQAGNPLHFLLLIITFAALLFMMREFDSLHRSILWYALGVVLAFITFCAVIRWQPWGSRFHLPIFILAAALFGLVAERLLRPRWLLVCISALLLVNALPYLLSNSIRSILRTKNFPTLALPRSELYFADQHLAIAPADIALAHAIRVSSCGHIAIDPYIPLPDDQIQHSPPGFWIYPLLAQLDIDGRGRTIQYINVQNSTRNFAAIQPKASACAIVCLDCLSSRSLKSDAHLGPTQTFGESELTFPTPYHR